MTNPRATRRHDEGGRVADEHVFTMIFEASGEVTPAKPEAEPAEADATEPEPEEDEQ